MEDLASNSSPSTLESCARTKLSSAPQSSCSLARTGFVSDESIIRPCASLAFSCPLCNSGTKDDAGGRAVRVELACAVHDATVGCGRAAAKMYDTRLTAH